MFPIRLLTSATRPLHALSSPPTVSFKYNLIFIQLRRRLSSSSSCLPPTPLSYIIRSRLTHLRTLKQVDHRQPRAPKHLCAVRLSFVRASHSGSIPTTSLPGLSQLSRPRLYLPTYLIPTRSDPPPCNKKHLSQDTNYSLKIN